MRIHSRHKPAYSKNPNGLVSIGPRNQDVLTDLKAVDLDRTMGTLGETALVHLLGRVASEPGPAWRSLYKCPRAGVETVSEAPGQ